MQEIKYNGLKTTYFKSFDGLFHQHQVLTRNTNNLS